MWPAARDELRLEQRDHGEQLAERVDLPEEQHADSYFLVFRGGQILMGHAITNLPEEQHVVALGRELGPAGRPPRVCCSAVTSLVSEW